MGAAFQISGPPSHPRFQREDDCVWEAALDGPLIGQVVREMAGPQSVVSSAPRHTFSWPVVVGR
ncbi:hypothetical protein H114_14958 [Streptomyces gancidicus BKS 13-15]|uniref:Uncharacterized protein n=1 Tax=Streptomyces gancidicus BKS 13-15 TaxID=1284664 RepID=M3BW68_STREZ|nr:hypothetical protein H114_14958 [Streptomyces gancidicus BKS 13-15]